jgi:hypothetical protein
LIPGALSTKSKVCNRFFAVGQGAGSRVGTRQFQATGQLDSTGTAPRLGVRGGAGLLRGQLCRLGRRLLGRFRRRGGGRLGLFRGRLERFGGRLSGRFGVFRGRLGRFGRRGLGLPNGAQARAKVGQLARVEPGVALQVAFEKAKA